MLWDLGNLKSSEGKAMIQGAGGACFVEMRVPINI